MGIIENHLETSIRVKQEVLENLATEIQKSADIIIDALRRGNKILTCGNGGSAADAQHLSAELMVRYREDRMSLPSVALTTNPSTITACANDYAFDQIFARQVEGLANPGDVLVGITASGNSPNILEAFEAAQKKGIHCICLTGMDGGKTKRLALQSSVVVPSSITAHIQEAHITIIHVWCALIDQEFVKRT